VKIAKKLFAKEYLWMKES